MSMSPAQCRAARGLLNWSQAKLAELAGVARATLADFEGGKRIPIANNLAAIREAFEAAGIIFIAENGEGPGVRLKKQKPDEGTRPQQLTSENDT
jgi:transcriptional regulator with XRE-family HTH domain